MQVTHITDKAVSLAKNNGKKAMMATMICPACGKKVAVVIMVNGNPRKRRAKPLDFDYSASGNVLHRGHRNNATGNK